MAQDQNTGHAARLMRFFGVQSIGTVADFVVALLLRTLGLGSVVAVTIGFFLGTCINYLGHHHITFATGDGAPPSFGAFAKYVVSVLASLGVRLLALVAVETGLGAPFWVALIVAFGASFAVSYLFSLYWVFRRST